jgi:MutS domain V
VPDPHAEYSKRLKAHLQTIAEKERAHIRLGNSKLAVIVIAVVLVWLSLGKHLLTLGWVAAPVIVYVVLAILHELTVRSRTRAETAASFYRKGIARIEDRWAGTGEAGERFRDAKHIYADDLDLFGRGGLFELLSTARLPMGENRLAAWLCSPARAPEIIERQKLIAEIREKLDLREDMAVIGQELRVRLDPESLTSWSESKASLPSSAFRAVAALLAISFAISLYYLVRTGVIPPALVVLAIAGLFHLSLKKRAKSVVESLHSNAEGLLLFSKLLSRLESEEFESPRLAGFIQELKRTAHRASRSIRKLAQIVAWIDAREGLLARLIEIPFLYTVQVAFAAEAWRREFGTNMRTWITIVAEMEALLSLAAYSFEHPSDPFPEFVEASDRGAVFDGEELGHPLIASSQCVRNSVRLDSGARVLFVSGSNMSGKSTLLRTLGINAVLAMTGAPIRGSSLRLTLLGIGTRIRSTDSLQEARSSFYTEILRIREVFKAADSQTPLLFLFDELLEGTNSKDRRIGAEGLVRALLDRGAIGLISTHDLALTAITVALANLVRNVHFQDYVEDGKMRFDYKLRDGVVEKSNALELMRLIGLKV